MARSALSKLLTVFPSRARATPVARYDKPSGAARLVVQYLEERALPSGGPGSDDFGDGFTDGHTVTLSPSGSGSQAGTVETPGDADVFRVVPPVGGTLIVQQPAAGCDPAAVARLAAFDAAGRPVGGDGDAVQFDVAAGKSYYVRADRPGGTTGSYALVFGVASPVAADDFGDAPENAIPLDVSGGPASVAGAVDSPGDADLFRVTPSVTGPIVVRLDAATGSTLDTVVTVFDADRHALALDDDGGPGLFSRLVFEAVAGQAYYVQAASYGDSAVTRGTSTGRYVLTAFTPPPGDDYPDAPAAAAPLDGSAVGVVGYPGDADVFRFTAAATGPLLIRLDPAPGSPLDPVLSVFDASEVELADADSGLGSDPRAVQFHVDAGRGYLVVVAGRGASTGAYTLTAAPAPPVDGDDTGDAPEDARPLALDAAGSGARAGVIDAAGDVDVFAVVAPFTGRLEVRQDAAPGSPLDSVVTVFDAAGEFLTEDDDSGPGLNSLARFDVTAGEVYYLRAAGFGTSAGRYRLTVAPAPPADDVGNSFADATPLAVDGGRADAAGAIDYPGDVDLFAYTAPLTGQVIVRQRAIAGSGLDPVLTAFKVFGSSPEEFAVDDDGGGGLDSLIRLQVVEGRTYFFQAAGYGTTTGPYALSIDPVAVPAGGTDDAGDTFAEAVPLGPGGAAGAVDFLGDADLYRFVAPASGPLTVELAAAPGSSLDTLLAVFDDSGAEVAGDNDGGAGLNSSAQLSVVAGRTYFIQASGFGAGTGRYVLTTSLRGDDAGDTFAAARPVALDPAGAGHVCGTAEDPGDEDVIRFDAPAGGPLSARLTADDGSPLAGFLFLFDKDGSLLASDGGAGGVTPDVQFSAQAGATYFVKAAFGGFTGRYLLAITPLPDDAGDTFEDATIIPLSGPAARAGAIDVPGDADFFQVVAPATGVLSVRLAAAGGGPLDGTLAVFDEAGERLAENDDAGPGTTDSAVQFRVKQGGIYFLRAAGYGRDTGGYVLTVAPADPVVAMDDFGDTADQAQAVVVPDLGGPAEVVAGRVEAGDADLFRLVAPRTGRLTVRLTPTPGSNDLGLRGFAVLPSAPGAGLVQVASDARVRGVMQLDVIAGQVYFVRVAAADGRAGGYELAFDPVGEAGPADPKLVDQRAALSAADFLGVSFSKLLAALGRDGLRDAGTAVGDAVVAEFVAAQRAARGGTLPTDYLVIWLDPVDYIVTDPRERQTGFTQSRGPVREVGNAFLSRNGVLDLLIIPDALASGLLYRLELIGVGADRSLVGARLVRSDGSVESPRVRREAGAPAGRLEDVTASESIAKAGVLFVLDFGRDAAQGAAGPGPNGPAAGNRPAGPAGSAATAQGGPGVFGFGLTQLLGLLTTEAIADGMGSRGSSPPPGEAAGGAAPANAAGTAAVSPSGPVPTQTGDGIAQALAARLGSLDRIVGSLLDAARWLPTDAAGALTLLIEYLSRVAPPAGADDPDEPAVQADGLPDGEWVAADLPAGPAGVTPIVVDVMPADEGAAPPATVEDGAVVPEAGAPVGAEDPEAGDGDLTPRLLGVALAAGACYLSAGGRPAPPTGPDRRPRLRLGDESSWL